MPNKKKYHIDGFSDRLQLAIGKSGLKIKDIEEALECHNLIYTYIKNECYPTALKLIRLCKILNCSADWLLGLEEEK